MTTRSARKAGGSRWRLSTTEMGIFAGGAALALLAILLAAYGGVPKAQPFAGAIVILGIAYALSTNRRAIDLKTVLWGLGLQIVFALFVLKNAWGQRAFKYLGDLITRLLDFANVGASFVFGPLGDKQAWPHIMTTVLGAEGARYSMIFAFQEIGRAHV